ncbi:DUF4349 domain-containing protein [Paucisalibacillus sp. EB02]|uniref:DUF4349 domain-containing protein n=1 Tax=Paucisalibacillus sp. EB02 TaxID=1347087 RepID=UPI0005A8F782|nr:DUF4349 domain-containing protein [Paucisalibacillus sp. EB02]
MKKSIFLILVGLCFFMFLAACSNESKSGDSAELAEDYDSSEEKSEGYSLSNSAENESVNEESDAPQDDKRASTNKADLAVDRKIIYTANLAIEVKDFQPSFNHIQSKVTDYGGYIVESNMSGVEGDDMANGYITVRIPQDQFRDFIQLVEDGSSKVLESTISGQDVTEEYVDLESRLKSKRVVEERLLSFMEKAEKTEDLLTISNDLAKVQEEIEEVLGRMKYLENRAELATITIHIQENNVKLSTIHDDDLNTWEQTKQQFVKSINMLLAFFSNLFVFLVGNLPVLLLLGIIGAVTYLFIRKRKESRPHD